MKEGGSILLILSVMALLASAFAGEEESIEVGDRFRDFELPDVNGNPVRTKALREDKVLVLEFTTSWCKSCTAQLEEMQTLAAKVDRKKVQIVEVNVLSPLSHIQIELREQKRRERYPVLVDSRKKVAEKFFVNEVPAIFIVDTEGIIRFTGHMESWKTLKKVVDKYTKKER